MFCSVHFSCTCVKQKTMSIVPFPLLNPHWGSGYSRGDMSIQPIQQYTGEDFADYGKKRYTSRISIVFSVAFLKGCSDSELTWIFEICMLFSPKSPNFITLGQGVHKNGPSYIGHSKNKILGETPLNMTWIEDFPCLIRNFSIRYHLIFVVSPDGFNSNLKIFF